MEKDALIYIAGHRGLVGSGIVRRLRSGGYENLLTSTHAELDLCEQIQVRAFFNQHRPEFVFVAAARVGGIHANERYPVEFLYDNLMIEANLIRAAFDHEVKKLLFLGSTCIYPNHAPQPMNESSLLTGPLEPTNEWYAVAKIAGIKLCQALHRQYGAAFHSAMPTNLYGPGDNFDLQTSHVLPALIRKFHDAKAAGAPHVEVWGSGRPMREFLHVDDCADACVFPMNQYSESDIINIGFGSDISIADLARMIRSIVGYEGEIVYDDSKPDGTPRKLVDVGKLFGLGWRPRVVLEDGIRATYKWYRAQRARDNA